MPSNNSLHPLKVAVRKLIGVTWDKRNDMLSVVFTQNQDVSTKREILAKLASIYDPLWIRVAKVNVL